MQLRGKISSIFWKGLFTLLPLYLTAYFLFWLTKNLESTFGGILKAILGSFYIPGMGLVSAIILIFGFGLLMQIYITQYLNDLLNRTISRLPLIGDIYASLQSIVKYLTKDASEGGEEVVMVRIEHMDMELLGIVTRKDFKDTPDGVGHEAWLSVYLPMSYQVGGYTVYIPESRVRHVNMTPKQALKWALIAGIEP